MFDKDLARQVAAALQTNEAYIEKDWHLVRALGVIASLSMEGIVPALSGGTSLAGAWRLIHRFSEDIDFKVTVQAKTSSAARKMRSAYRDNVIAALTTAGFVLDGEPLVGNMSQFFRASFRYGPVSSPAPGIRPSLQVEMTFSGTHRPPTACPVQSLMARAAKAMPEVFDVLCVDLLETAADKIAALSWRSSVRDRKSKHDDPSVVRHLHDLAALAPMVQGKQELPALAHELLRTDARRTGKEEDGLAVRNALLTVEVVLIVGAEHGVGKTKCTRELPVEALLQLGLPPTVRYADQPVRHAVADADLDLDAAGRALHENPLVVDDAETGRRSWTDEKHRLRLARPQLGNATAAGLEVLNTALLPSAKNAFTA